MLLRQIGIPFQVVKPALDERRHPDEPAVAYVRRLAVAKARSVDSPLPILAADTTVAVGERIFGKPADRSAFFAMMKALAGREHRVYTALALRWNGREAVAVAQAQVSFRSIDEDEMAAYWRTGEPADTAGGYGIQGIGGMFVREIHGGYDTVVGLPLAETERLLKSFGIDPWRWRETGSVMHDVGGDAKHASPATRRRPAATRTIGNRAAREELLVDVATFETRVALMVDGQLCELHIERADQPSLVGNIYVGRVLRQVSGIQAVFMDVGLPRPAFLHLRDMPGDPPPSPHRQSQEAARLPRQGERVLVQVVKDPLNEKGARLAANIALSARHLVLQPFATGVGVSRRIDDEAERERLRGLVHDAAAEILGEGTAHGRYIVRTGAQGVREEQLHSDLKFLEERWDFLLERWPASASPALLLAELPLPMRVLRDLASSTLTAMIVNDDDAHQSSADYAAGHVPALAGRVHRYRGEVPLFDSYDLETTLSHATDRRVSLPGGGCLIIEETSAMTTIDVNSGTATASSNGVRKTTEQETALLTNLEAAHAIPPELRRRNIGGIIVVDFIDMTDPSHQRQVLDGLRQAAAADPAPFRASDFSPLGLVEISRRRLRESLTRQHGEPCQVCAGTGYARSAQSICYEIFRAVQRRRHLDDGALEYVVRARQEVVDRLRNEEASHLAALRREAGRPIVLQVDANCRDQFELTTRCTR